MADNHQHYEIDNEYSDCSLDPTQSIDDATESDSPPQRALHNVFDAVTRSHANNNNNDSTQGQQHHFRRAALEANTKLKDTHPLDEENTSAEQDDEEDPVSLYAEGDSLATSAAAVTEPEEEHDNNDALTSGGDGDGSSRQHLIQQVQKYIRKMHYPHCLHQAMNDDGVYSRLMTSYQRISSIINITPEAMDVLFGTHQDCTPIGFVDKNNNANTWRGWIKTARPRKSGSYVKIQQSLFQDLNIEANDAVVLEATAAARQGVPCVSVTALKRPGNGFMKVSDAFKPVVLETLPPRVVSPSADATHSPPMNVNNNTATATATAINTNRPLGRARKNQPLSLATIRNELRTAVDNNNNTANPKPTEAAAIAAARQFLRRNSFGARYMHVKSDGSVAMEYIVSVKQYGWRLGQPLFRLLFPTLEYSEQLKTDVILTDTKTGTELQGELYYRAYGADSIYLRTRSMCNALQLKPPDRVTFKTAGFKNGLNALTCHVDYQNTEATLKEEPHYEQGHVEEDWDEELPTPDLQQRQARPSMYGGGGSNSHWLLASSPPKQQQKQTVVGEKRTVVEVIDLVSDYDDEDDRGPFMHSQQQQPFHKRNRMMATTTTTLQPQPAPTLPHPAFHHQTQPQQQQQQQQPNHQENPAPPTTDVSQYIAMLHEINTLLRAAGVVQGDIGHFQLGFSSLTSLDDQLTVMGLLRDAAVLGDAEVCGFTSIMLRRFGA